MIVVGACVQFSCEPVCPYANIIVCNKCVMPQQPKKGFEQNPINHFPPNLHISLSSVNRIRKFVTAFQQKLVRITKFVRNFG